MTARRFDIEIEQGATFAMALTYKNASGVPVNLTGYTVDMQVRESVGGKLLVTASTANGKVTVSWAGEIDVLVPHGETALISGAERGVYDLFLRAPLGASSEKLLYGNVSISQSVMR